MEIDYKSLEGFHAHEYLAALVAVAQTDGLSEPVLGFLENQASFLGLSLDSFLESSEFEFSELIDQPLPTRMAVIRDCVLLASVDGNYSKNESAHVRALAAQVNIDADSVSQLEAWIRDYAEVVDRGAKLMGFGMT